MRANTGGQIAPKDVVGRDQIIERIWRTLEQQSVVLTAARRMGKTSILRKMEAEPRMKYLPVYHDLEDLRSPLEFAQSVYEDVEKFLTGKHRVTKRAHDFIVQLGGVQVDKLKLPTVLAPHWKTLLEKTVEDLTEHRDGSVVFFWDEMPMMLENIRQDHGEKTAMEVLDVLRALRQTYPAVRMVYTGSIGLHHVVTALKRSGYANSPTNDMKVMDVPPLMEVDAQQLALMLLAGENIAAANPEATAHEIAKSADNVAFYIHHVVDRLTNWPGEINSKAVQEVVSAFLMDAQDAWDMRHYRKRIDTYYLPAEQPLALRLLDVCAKAEQPLAQADVLNGLSSQIEISDEEQARTVLDSLLRDHYLTRQMDGTYQFYLPLIRRWWRMERGFQP